MQRMSALDPGFRAEGVLTFTLSPSRQKFPTAARTLEFYETVIATARAVPGVRAAAAGLGVPFTSSGHRFGLRPVGSTADVLVTVNHVTPEYFATLGIALREGRFLTDPEQRGARVVVVNQPLARALAGDGSPLGMRVPYSGESWEVVGVVTGTRQRQLREPPVPELFLPWRLAGARPLSVAIRTEGNPLSVLPAIASRIHELDPSVPLGSVATLASRLAEARQTQVFRASLVAALAAVAVLLAALGAYSVAAYAVSRRTREYGVRLALGERPSSIAGRALWTAAGPALQGVLIGLAVTMAAGRWLESYLFEVKARDPVTFAVAGLALMALAVVAAGRSAFKASRTDTVTNCLRMDT
jgi:putative ABC transport system permease protein